MNSSGITNPRFHMECTKEEIIARDKIIKIVQDLAKEHNIHICKAYFDWQELFLDNTAKPFLHCSSFGNREFDKTKPRQMISGVICEDN
jgi:hypothetical protein